MKNKFPYKGDTVTVTKDMCDMNGHMNVSFYSKVFYPKFFQVIFFTKLLVKTYLLC